jgi:hypothetical protein
LQAEPLGLPDEVEATGRAGQEAQAAFPTSARRASVTQRRANLSRARLRVARTTEERPTLLALDRSVPAPVHPGLASTAARSFTTRAAAVPAAPAPAPPVAPR